MKEKIRILHLEDSLRDSELICSLMESGSIEHNYFLADNEKDFINILETENIDIILSDYHLPDYNGNEALKIARERYSHMPFIFVSGAIGEDRAINAMLNGATDYVLKNKLERLVPAIKRAMHEHNQEIERNQAEAAQKLAEESLKESQERYHNIFESVAIGIYRTTPDGRILLANPSLVKILGFDTFENLALRNLEKNGFEPEYKRKKFRENIERYGFIAGLESVWNKNDGNAVFIRENAKVFRDDDGNVLYYDGTIEDITERKLAEQELVIVNKELAFQNEEKEKRAAELLIANIKKAEEEKYKRLIEEKNIVITDSIKYAKRIQQAILPRKEEIYTSLPQSFVLYKPKDIVSGDFYFFHKNNQFVFIAAADCTGHGVPGALMSMIGMEKLTEAVSQSTDTSDILKQLNIGIINSLHQSDSNDLIRDGMDIAICSIETKKRIVRYSGVNIPLWYIRNGKLEVEEIKGTKVVGGLTEENQRFDCHELKLQQGDTFYLSTDGFADQFNGQLRKKLMKKKFKETLICIQEKSMQEQEKYLNNFIENWKESSEQIDDILVIGVRL
jgi:PAS domain S-box-containing protein